MPSYLKTALLTLSHFLTTTLAAPPAIPPGLALISSPLFTKRADYHPTTSGGERYDYCGEANPYYWFDASAPLASDCTAVYERNPGPGYWTVSPAETEAARAAPGGEGWVRLAQAGTCAFEVRLERYAEEVVGYRFGTNDLRFYVRSNVVREAKEGKVGAGSAVACFNGEKMVTVEWRVVDS